MITKGQIYKCEACENIVEIIHEGTGELVCCNQPMKLFEEKTKEEGNEKHRPIIEKNEEGVLVKVGSIPHPMEPEHYIEWIEISTDIGSSKKFLNPEGRPEKTFPVKAEVKQSRTYCNVHGLWTNS